MPTFTWIANYGASNEVKPKVLKSQFGDGYEQRVGDGLNTLPRSWSLTFTDIESEIDTIEDFLITQGGVASFDWTPPRGLVGKWICDTWKRDISNPAYDSISTTFREVFEP